MKLSEISDVKFQKQTGIKHYNHHTKSNIWVCKTDGREMDFNKKTKPHLRYNL